MPGTIGSLQKAVKVASEIPYGQAYPIIMALHDIQAEGIDLGTEELKE